MAAVLIAPLCLSACMNAVYGRTKLFARAVVMEKRALAGEGQAPATTSAGLGRYFSWATFVKEALKTKKKKGTLKGAACMSDAGVPEMDCGCYDGD